MQKGNVLVIGNSGVGKSTLINAVLGEDVAKTSWGEKGTTSQLDIYEGEPINVIDTIGFEPSIFKSNKAISLKCRYYFELIFKTLWNFTHRNRSIKIF